MNKEQLLKEFVKIYGQAKGINDWFGSPVDLLIWYENLSSSEKEEFVNHIIEEFDNLLYSSAASHIKSEKIFKYAINHIKKSIKEGKVNEIRPVHFSILLKYTQNDDEKNTILSLMENKTLLDSNQYIRTYPLKILSAKYPEYLEKYLHKFKEIYASYGNSSIIDVYSGLIILHKENFPEVFFKISKNLTEKEIDRVLENLPVIFSDCKHDNIKEEVYMSLEKLFGKSISRKIKA